ncbi:MAG: hypothetical protein KAI66_08695 [Lentisphaeria bacterium]|nr:hypothetical protein [Lentisphaeria bacterium]
MEPAGGSIPYRGEEESRSDSYTSPGYCLKIEISPSDFRLLSGIAFDVSVVFGDDCQALEGMLIIPEGNGFPDVSGR